MRLAELGYSKELMAVEKELSELSHLDPALRLKVPKRRIDLLCFAKEGSLLIPLLLVECKAVPLTERMKRQVMGYNYYVKARHVALVSHKSAWFGTATSEGYTWNDHVPQRIKSK